MPQILVTPPASEPVTLADMKAFLKVDGADEDALIASLTAAARAHVEATAGRALVAQTWRFVRDLWPPSGRLILTVAPIMSLVSVKVTTAAGPETVPNDRFRLDGAGVPPRLAWSPGAVPAPAVAIGGVEIEAVAGYGAASAVPPPLVHAVRLLVAHWFENRALVSIGHEVAVLPRAAADLIAPYVVRRLA